MGKVDPLHPDLSVDPFNILRPYTKLTHQLPLVTFLFFKIYSCFCLIFWIFDKWNGFRWARTHRLWEREWVLDWNNTEGEWILIQTSLCLPIVQGTSLALMTTYSTQVSPHFNSLVLFETASEQTSKLNRKSFFGFSGYINGGISVGITGWRWIKKGHSSSFPRMVF